MKLPFGKKVQCGNFYVVKHSKALSKKELKALRQANGIPEDVAKYLTRGSLPYITVSTVSDSWKIDFVCGMMMFKAIDEIPVAVDEEGVYTYYGMDRISLGNIINGWFAYTSTVGDAEYQTTVIKAMQDYLERMAEKNKAPLSEEENKEVMKESEENENHKAVILKMSDEIKKEGK